MDEAKRAHWARKLTGIHANYLQAEEELIHWRHEQHQAIREALADGFPLGVAASLMGYSRYHTARIRDGEQ